MASVKTLEAFDKRVIKAITKLGAKPCVNQFGMHRYTIETKAGELTVSLHINTEPSKLYSIFCCFDDVDKAKAVLTPFNQSNLNKHSGKWNYHRVNGKECFEEFISSLKEIM